LPANAIALKLLFNSLRCAAAMDEPEVYFGYFRGEVLVGIAFMNNSVVLQRDELAEPREAPAEGALA
jgi:hypothetical protein